MPQYYNLTNYSSTNGLIDIFKVTDSLMAGVFSLFLIISLALFILIVRIQRGDSPTNAIILSSFYSLMFAIILYVSGVIYSGVKFIPGLYVFVPAVILIATSIVKWYNNK